MKKRIFPALIVLLLITSSLFAVTTSRVEKDDNGWRFFVNDEPTPVYGMVWSYTPIGEGTSYSLWSESPELIKKTIDTDMYYLRNMGVTMIRCFDDVPPEWIEYIYHEYGITTMINNLLGRYGVTANGIWYSQTDYADRYTQQELINMAAASAAKYKDVDGVVMYMLGNESNYGLVWEGSDIQDLPTENQNAIMAGYLYDLLEKAMAKIKEIDPDRVVGFINGDVQNMELIAELCPSLEVFGVNIYRGGAFGDGFYNTVASSIDKPILITESGSDAFNAITGQEDQWMQAYYISQQWEDIYNHAYGKGRSGNIIGAFIFEWLDEWWKVYQYRDLDIHNTNATWGNAGYDLDYIPGGNNMDEEWFGIAAQGIDDGGIAKRVPRASYYMLLDIFKVDMFKASQQEIDYLFSTLDMNQYLARGTANTLSDKIDTANRIWISNATLSTDMTAPIAFSEDTFTGYNTVKARAEGELTISANAFKRLSGSLTVNAYTDKPLYLLEEANPIYNDYHISLNKANISYSGTYLDINAHYHNQIGGFSSMGDVFTLVPDQYDNSAVASSPTGIEIIGKDIVEGLRIVAGPQIYDGARPQVAAGYHKYFPGDLFSWYISGLAGVEYITDYKSTGSTSQLPINAKASLSGAIYFDPWVDVQLSFLMTGIDKIGAKYASAKGGEKEINMLDTLGGQIRVESKMFQRMNIFAQFDYRGLVAQTEEPDARNYRFYVDGGEGNRMQAEAGVNFTYGPHSAEAVIRWREPLEDAMDRGADSPFRVGGNNRVLQAELSYIYDEEGMTNFYAWNREDIENSWIAGGIAIQYSIWEGAKDKVTYVAQDGVSTYEGASSEATTNTFRIKGNVILNLLPGLRVALHGGIDRQLLRTYDESYPLLSYNFGFDVRWNKLLLKTDFTVDGLGPQQWQKDIGISYPYQWTVDLRYGFNIPALLNANNSVGIRWDGVVFGAHSTYGWDKFFIDQYDAIGKIGSLFTVYYNLSW